jgi:transposase
MINNEKPTPAELILQKFGTNAELSRILDVSRSTITRWSYSKDNKGTGGVVPQRHWPALIKAARKRKIRLSLKDLSGL